MRVPTLVKHQLVYASCWEDARIDRAALLIQPGDRVLTITSAGCNVLAYLQDNPEHIAAVDINHRQNALLELKIAGIRRLPFDEFFQLFGRGYSPRASRVYASHLRAELPLAAQRYWDRGIRMFANPRRSFYYHGGVGRGAWWLQWYIKRVLGLGPALRELFTSDDVDQQVRIYRDKLQARFWNSSARRLLRYRWSVAAAGITAAQWRHARRDIPDVADYLDRCAESVLSTTLLRDNPFWQVYLYGQYTPDCCPDYLRPDVFARLRDGLVDRISIHTCSLLEFLRQPPMTFTRFALLDHFDWLAGSKNDAELRQELQFLLRAAQPESRFVWRSMGHDTRFVGEAIVEFQGAPQPVSRVLRFDTAAADDLRRRERANTYARLCVASLPAESGAAP